MMKCEPRDAKEEEPWTWGPPPEQDEPAEKLEDVNNLGPWKIHNYSSYLLFYIISKSSTFSLLV